MEYTMIQDYKNIANLRASFNELARLVFGIDFERWYQLGFWSDRYLCYSFEHDGRVVANVSASLMELIIDGKRVNAVQIGTVMTHPEHRKKGLAEKLMKLVLTEYEKQADLIFLFGNLGADGFYSRFEFDIVYETQFSTSLFIGGSDYHKARKLALSSAEDIDILRRLAFERIPLSSTFGLEHAEGILEWHCLNVFPQDIYYIGESDSIVICRSEGHRIDLYDVVSRNRQDLRRIVGAIMPAGEYEVIFHFTPDFDDIKISVKPFETDDYKFYIKSNSVCLNGTFFYPYTAHA